MRYYVVMWSPVIVALVIVVCMWHVGLWIDAS